MSEEIRMIHHSQQRCYRMPVGAVPTESAVKLGLDVETKDQVRSVKLRVWQDKVGESLFSMTETHKNDTRSRYTYTIKTPDTGCLLWYYFIVECEDGVLWYGNNSERLGGEGQICASEPPSFQITVYARDSVTPDWFKHTVMYQIFPDRFNRCGNTIVPKRNAVIHADWHNQPCYFKDPDTKEIVAYDFFGGNLAGIKEKLGYLKDLGISVIYFNPVFSASSNHRYDTGDYHQIDPILGSNEEFADLCQTAEAMGIRIIMDGVFSHTGNDSRYFNSEGNYDEIGAFQSKASPYYEWYDFTSYPNEYNSWWGFKTLPNIKETTPSYMDFIINNDDSVLKYWLKQGAAGWRLDVIDELPPKFSRQFFKVLKEENPEAVLIGEVWEDASNKVSYSEPREYLCGGEMDSAMNYPLRRILLDFALDIDDVAKTNRRIMSLIENYPKQNLYAMMNLLGSHDVERVITLLGEAPPTERMPAIEQSRFRLSAERYQLAVQRLRFLVLWQMTFPGVPCVYYGDEAGMQGYRDPYNRTTYCWGSEDQELQAWYKTTIALRNAHQALRTGDFQVIYAAGDVYGYARYIRGGRDVFGAEAADDTFLVLLNRSEQEAEVIVDVRGLCYGTLRDVLGGGRDVKVRSGKVRIVLPPLQGVLYRQAEENGLERSAGILMHPTSLPSKYGIGDLGKSAYDFVNFLVKAKQKMWQILPLNPVGYGYSPYQSPSAFAGNPMLISLGRLVADGLLTPQEVKPPTQAQGIDFAKAMEFKKKCLRLAYKKFVNHKIPREYKEFCQKEAKWLDDYALFMALKYHFNDVSWNCWNESLVKREPAALAKYRKLLADEITYYKFIQYQFFKQWLALKNYANMRGVKIIGDIPIFIAHDSADVWANQDLFTLDERGKAEKVAGVPPDYFSATGQLWGNPHYRWDRMKKDDYAWWRDRITATFSLVNIVRIDHFRGFEAYWEVDGSAETAIEGRWVKGPAQDFFRAVEKHFGKLPIIAEDLGVITDEVNDLKDEFALPGMKVLHFELYLDEFGKMDFHCEKNCVVYTGTHDNNTTVGWLEHDIDDRTLEAVGELLNVNDVGTKEACRALIAYAYAANAAAVVIPMQDWLALGQKDRMNKPGTVDGNWQWRATEAMFSDALAQQIAALVDQYKR